MARSVYLPQPLTQGTDKARATNAGIGWEQVLGASVVASCGPCCSGEASATATSTSHASNHAACFCKYRPSELLAGNAVWFYLPKPYIRRYGFSPSWPVFHLRNHTKQYHTMYPAEVYLYCGKCMGDGSARGGASCCCARTAVVGCCKELTFV